MPPKGTPKAGRGGGAAGPKKPAAAKSPRGRGKKKVEEEEDEEEEEEEMMPTKAAPKRKTPKKGGSEDEEEEDDGEEEEGDEDEDEDEDEEFDEDEEEDEEDEEEESKPKKTLFIKNLPSTTTEEEVKALCPDIQNVKLEVAKKPGDKIYAVVDFADEETATKNLEVIKSKKVGDSDIIVDYVGSQSIVTFVTPALTPSSDPLKLYVTGFGRDITIDQLKGMFPTSTDVTLPLNPKDNNRPIGYAFIHYEDEAVARKAHDGSQDLSYQNRTLVVMYGKKTPPPGSAPPAAEPKRKSTGGAKRGPKSKKAKKEESEEEEEEEDGDEDGE